MQTAEEELSLAGDALHMSKHAQSTNTPGAHVYFYCRLHKRVLAVFVSACAHL